MDYFCLCFIQFFNILIKITYVMKLEAPIFGSDGLCNSKKINLNILSYRIKSISCTSSHKDKNMYTGQRYLHAGQVHEGRIYLNGGTTLNGPQKDNKTYSLDMVSKQWKHVHCSDNPYVRDSHSFVQYQNLIFCFGGAINHQTPTNDVLVFDPCFNTWKCIYVEGQLPCERELATFITIQNQFVLMFGGVNYQKQILFDDAFIFKKSKWYRLNVTNQVPLRLKFGIAVCGNRIFIHAGEGPGVQKVQYYDDIYEVRIQQIELQISFTKVKVKKKNMPCKRSCHGMVQLSNRYFAVIGGQTLEQMQFEFRRVTLNDLWIFDVFQSAWQQIQPKSIHLTYLKQFMVKKVDDQIVIFGGISSTNKHCQDTTIINFQLQDSKMIEQCKQCQTTLLNRQVTNFNNNFSFSAGFIQSMCMSLKSPFQAIQKIIQFTCQLKSSYVNIIPEYTTNTQQQYGIITFSFDGLILTSTQFLQLASCLDVQSQQNQSMNMHFLIPHCLRLGKTVLFIQKGPTKRNVMLFSVQEKYSPSFQKDYVCYKYIEQHLTQGVQPRSGLLDKSKIINILHCYVTDPHGLLADVNESKLFVFNPNIFLTSQKAYYYELIFPDSSINDIFLFRNQKKAEFLSKINFIISDCIEFSLKTYLSRCWLNQKYKNIKIYLNNNNEYIQYEDYLLQLLKLKQLGQVNQLKVGKIKNTQKVQLFQVTTNACLPQNNGILIFKNGVFVNRYTFALGQLFHKHFYKKKYRNFQNPFPIMGVIYLPHNIKLTDFDTRLSKTKTNNSLKQQIQMCIDQIQSQIYQEMDIQKPTRQMASESCLTVFKKVGGEQGRKKVKLDI